MTNPLSRTGGESGVPSGPVSSSDEHSTPAAREHVVMFSGGIGSWAAAKRVADKHGTDHLTMLFTDTLVEDADLYRFLEDAAVNVGGKLVRIADGRTPFEVFRDERFLGNSRIDPCSKILKRNLADKWLKDNRDPANTVCYVGIDFTEGHRFDDGEGRGIGPRKAAKGWRFEAPMMEPPYLMKDDMLRAARGLGLQPSRSYAEGFSHDNCGGACCKAGQGQWALLLSKRRAWYLENEANEEAMRLLLGRDVAMMSETVAGVKRPLTLRTFRERIEAGAEVDLFAQGGCGCFLDDSEAA